MLPNMVPDIEERVCSIDRPFVPHRLHLSLTIHRSTSRAVAVQRFVPSTSRSSAADQQRASSKEGHSFVNKHLHARDCHE